MSSVPCEILEILIPNVFNFAPNIWGRFCSPFYIETFYLSDLRYVTSKPSDEKCSIRVSSNSSSSAVMWSLGGRLEFCFLDVVMIHEERRHTC